MSELQFLEKNGARIAYKTREGNTPGVLFLGGFRSNMEGTKAQYLDAWAARHGQAFRRFDYFALGQSPGDFNDACLSRWRDDALAMLDDMPGKQILVGSSMGGWISLMLARLCPEKIAGLVLLAPAPDFSENLMWVNFPENVRKEIMEKGVWHQPNPYEPPRPITRRFIEDGRNNLVLGEPLKLDFPVRILQGMKDADVPWKYAMQLLDLIEGDVRMTLLKNSDHRLSEPAELLLTAQTIEALLET
jgi:pimeloyl-ACP methyl ester carboxylesterase